MSGPNGVVHDPEGNSAMHDDEVGDIIETRSRNIVTRQRILVIEDPHAAVISATWLSIKKAKMKLGTVKLLPLASMPL